jgi:hypothetical protein
MITMAIRVLLTMLKIIPNVSVHVANPTCLSCLVRLHEEDCCLIVPTSANARCRLVNDKTRTHVGLVRSLTPAINYIPTERQENHT